MIAATFAGSLLALASAVLWAAANVSIQGSARRFGSFGALLWTQLLGGTAVACAALVVEGMPGSLSAKGAAALLVAGVAAVVAYSGLFEALRRGQVAVVSPVISAWTIISVLIAALVFDEQVGGFVAAGVALVVLGNGALARSTAADRGGETPGAAMIAAVVSALGFGVMVPAFTILGAEVGRLWTIPAVWSVELLIGVPILLRFGLIDRRPRSAHDWLVASRVAVFEAGGFVAISLALGLAPIAVVSPLSSLSTAGSVALGLLVLRERVGPGALFGAALASVGVILVHF